MSPYAIAAAAFAAMLAVSGGFYAAYVGINKPEPRHERPLSARDARTLAIFRSLNGKGPALVRADPALRVRMAVLRAIQARAVPAPIRPRHARPAYVSGPAVAPSLPAAEPPSPQGGAAGPETLSWQAGDRRGEARGKDSGLGADRVRPCGCQLTEPLHSEDPGLPPVDQAAHLQPIDWADTTGSFRAICAGDER